MKILATLFFEMNSECLAVEFSTFGRVTNDWTKPCNEKNLYTSVLCMHRTFGNESSNGRQPQTPAIVSARDSSIINSNTLARCASTSNVARSRSTAVLPCFALHFLAIISLRISTSLMLQPPTSQLWRALVPPLAAEVSCAQLVLLQLDANTHR